MEVVSPTLSVWVRTLIGSIALDREVVLTIPITLIAPGAVNGV
jgi:hypothetical protein